MLLDELCETVVRFLLLHTQHLRHAAACRRQIQLPHHKTLIDFAPVIKGPAVSNLHRNVLERLLIALLRHLVHYLALVHVLLQREEYLLRVDGFYEVVGYLLAYSLVHDVLLLALGDHHDGCLRLYLLYAFQRLESADAGHHLVEKYKVEGLSLAQFDCVKAVIGYDDIVATCLKEYGMGLEMFYLVIYPEDFLFHLNTIFLLSSPVSALLPLCPALSLGACFASPPQRRNLPAVVLSVPSRPAARGMWHRLT